MKKVMSWLLIFWGLGNLTGCFAVDQTAAQGIILADNQRIIEIFRSRSREPVEKLITDLADYDKVILHLGAQYVFRRGSAFFYQTSQDNLQYFCRTLEQNDQRVYLWFLDSFGGSSFNDIYNNYQSIIAANKNYLERLNLEYSGLVIDLEWINLNIETDNADKYLEILKYLRREFSNQKLYAFVSLIDNPAENRRRGYREQEMLQYLDNIITMLYLKDGGYDLKNGQLEFVFTPERLSDLRNYYYQQGYQVAVSLEGGIILERNNNLYYIKTINHFPAKEYVTKQYQKEEKYVTITGYQPQESFYLERNDGVREKVLTSDRLHFFKVNRHQVVDKGDYIWEYFSITDD